MWKYLLYRSKKWLYCHRNFAFWGPVFFHNFSGSCNQCMMEVFCFCCFRVGRDSFPIRPTLSSEQVPCHDWAFACMEIAVLPVPLRDSSIISGVCIWAVVELAVSLPEAGSCTVCAIPLLPSLILQFPVSLHGGKQCLCVQPLCTNLSRIKPLQHYWTKGCRCQKCLVSYIRGISPLCSCQDAAASGSLGQVWPHLPFFLLSPWRWASLFNA